jgi:hypothetical protein
MSATPSHFPDVSTVSHSADRSGLALIFFDCFSKRALANGGAGQLEKRVYFIKLGAPPLWLPIATLATRQAPDLAL